MGSKEARMTKPEVKTLDEILESETIIAVDLKEITPAHRAAVTKTHRLNLKQAILQWVDEVVIKDTTEMVGSYDPYAEMKLNVLNGQRAILKKHGWKGGEDG